MGTRTRWYPPGDSAGAGTMNPARFLEQYFYLGMALLIAATVMYGFSQTIETNLIHAVPARPLLLYLHAAVFSGWLAFFICQSLLIRVHNLRLHRTMGWLGVALGSAVFLVGIWTAIVMSRFRIQHFAGRGAVQILGLSFYDIAAFAVPFALAIVWRKRPEYHRRLMLLATCALTSAAFGRFPPQVMPRHWFFIGVDLLVALGVLRDLIVSRRIHRVYLVGLPAFVLCQSVVMVILVSNSPDWARIANAILR